MPASRHFVKLSRRTILVLPTLLVTTALLTTCSYDQAIAPATTPLPGALSADVTGPVPVLIGAGSIARCDRTNDEATARLLAAYPDAPCSRRATTSTGTGRSPTSRTATAPRGASTRRAPGRPLASWTTRRRVPRGTSVTSAPPRRAIPPSTTTATIWVRGTSWC